MGGLQLHELPYDYIRAGDSIEYYSMAFVCGDERGLRTATVASVEPKDEDYPIRISTGELLPTWIMIKQVRDDSSDASRPPPQWRKIRTFQYIKSAIEVETSAQRLNAVFEAMKADLFTKGREAMRSLDVTLSSSEDEDSDYGEDES